MDGKGEAVGVKNPDLRGEGRDARVLRTGLLPNPESGSRTVASLRAPHLGQLARRVMSRAAPDRWPCMMDDLVVGCLSRSWLVALACCGWEEGGRVESCTPLSCHAVWMQRTSQPLPLGCLSWAGACKLPHQRPLSRCSSAYRCYRNATPQPLLAVMSRVCISSGLSMSRPIPRAWEHADAVLDIAVQPTGNVVDHHPNWSVLKASGRRGSGRDTRAAGARGRAG